MRFPTVIGVLVVSAAALVGAAPTGGVLNGIDIESALIGLSRRNCRKGSCVTRAANDIVNVVDRCNSALALVPVGPCNDEDADALVGFTTQITNGLSEHQENCRGDNCLESGGNYPELDGPLSKCVGLAFNLCPELRPLIASRAGELEPVLRDVNFYKTLDALAIR